MKYCTKCGSELQDGTAFCPECGTPTQPPVNDQVNETGTKTDNASAKAPGAKKTSNALILGIVAVVAAFVPALNTASPILSIIGIVFGAKEAKESGEKTGLILSICSLIPTLLSAVTTIISLLITLFSTLVSGGTVLVALIPFFGLFLEMFEGMFNF